MTQTTTKHDAALERIALGVQTAQANWQAFLLLVAKMPKYSLNNLLLIWQQKPEATLVQGFHNWHKLNRHVKKGETGIQIYAPRVVKDAEGSSDIKGFHAVYVFDVSQTDGDPLPATPPTEYSDGEDAKAHAMFETLKQWLETRGCAVSFAVLEKHNANGAYYFKEHRIEIATKSGDILRLGTLIHEAAHALMHGNDIERKNQTSDSRELEAESTAAIVCQHFSIPRASSYDYIAMHNASAEQVLESGERITRTAKAIIKALEPTPEGA
jgi:antirestriction protein ArdC